MAQRFFSVLFTLFLIGCASSYPTFEEEQERQLNYEETEKPQTGLENNRKYKPLVLIRERRQLFGGRSGSSQQVGYKAGPAWGSMAHSGGPITYSGGVDLNSHAGHGLSGSLSHTPGFGGQGSVRGTVGILNTPNHQLSGFGQHDRNFDKHMHRLGPETNSAGLNYQHGSGANAFLSGSKTPGLPSTGSVGGSVPLHTGRDSSLSLSGQSTFGHGMKPDNQVGLSYQKTF